MFWHFIETKPNQSKTKLEYLLHFYAIKKKNYAYVFSDKRKLHLKWRDTFQEKKKIICLIKNASFCQRKCGVEIFQPAHFCFLYILLGLNFLFQIEEGELKSSNHTFQLPIICQLIFPLFYCSWLACFYLVDQEKEIANNLM